MGSTATAAGLCPDRPRNPAAAPESPPTGQKKLAFPRFTQQEPQRDREQMVLFHLPQVRLIAEAIRQRIGYTADLADLVGYGVIGLLRAVDRFDPSRGCLLKTYAEHRIRGAILDGLRRMDWLSRSARKKEQQYQEGWRQPQSDKPSVRAIGARQKRDAPLPRSGQGLVQPASPPHTPPMELINAGGDLEDLEKLSERVGLRNWFGAVAESPEAVCQRKEMCERLAQAIARLSRRHRRVLFLYYRQERSMKEIGELLHVHESRVSQIHGAALHRLRQILLGSHG